MKYKLLKSYDKPIKEIFAYSDLNKYLNKNNFPNVIRKASIFRRDGLFCNNSIFGQIEKGLEFEVLMYNKNKLFSKSQGILDSTIKIPDIKFKFDYEKKALELLELLLKYNPNTKSFYKN